MKFSAEKFRKNAAQAVRKRVPQSHLDVLDGMEVERAEQFGKITYVVDGIEHYFYPICPEWCKEG